MAGKAQPFSIRLSQVTDELVAEEAKRTRRSKGAIVEALAEEGLRMRRIPGIAFRGSDWNRRAWVLGTALDVWEVLNASRAFDSPWRMAEETDLSERQVRVALAYHEQYPAEIDEAIRQNSRPLEELQREFPWVETISVD